MAAVDGKHWLCKGCGRRFRHRFPGVLRCQHSTEAFRFKVFKDHWDGISRSRVAEREGIGSATVERHAEHFLGALPPSGPALPAHKCLESTSISFQGSTDMQQPSAI